MVLGSWPWCSRDDMVSSSVTEQVIGFMVSAGMQHTSHAFAAPATRQPHTPLQWSRFFKGFKLWASREDGGGANRTSRGHHQQRAGHKQPERMSGPHGTFRGLSVRGCLPRLHFSTCSYSSIRDMVFPALQSQQPRAQSRQANHAHAAHKVHLCWVQLWASRPLGLDRENVDVLSLARSCLHRVGHGQ